MRKKRNYSFTMNTTSQFNLSNETNCYYIFGQRDVTIDDNRVLVAVLCFIFIFVVTSNLMLIHGVVKTSGTWSRTQKLFLYLSSVDLTTGLITIPVQVSMIILGRNASCFQVGLQAFFNALTPLIAMFTIFTMSVLRFLAITRPMTIINNRAVSLNIALQALMAVTMTTFYVVTSQIPGSANLLGVFILLVTIMCIGLASVIGAVNLLLYWRLNTTYKQSSVKRIIRLSCTRAQEERLVRTHKKATKTLLFISISLFICYVPNGFLFGFISYHVLHTNHRTDLYSMYSPWAHLPMLLNAGLDSCIYIVRKARLYNYYKRLLIGCFYGNHFRRKISKNNNDLGDCQELSYLTTVNRRLSKI